MTNDNIRSIKLLEVRKDFLRKIQEVEKESLRESLYKEGLSRRLFNRYFKEGIIYVNKERVRKGYLLKKGDLIEIILNKELDYIEPEVGEIKILYEDHSLLIVNKEAGMVVHPIKYYTRGTLLNFVKGYFLKQGILTSPRLVNRLDKDTEGLIIIAKNSYVDSLMSDLIKDNRLDRKYIALVKGRLSKDFGLINKPILKVDGEMERIIDRAGKESRTEFKLLIRGEDHSLLELKLLTGRSHQIRIHLKSLGHEIVGDPIYGDGRGGPMYLCSYYLNFIHPISGKRVRVVLSDRLDKYKEFMDEL